mmetsp:Transcript_52515/g.151337  ORF Transcript_52515/g.151337 Transcript_52515/m.151337 type:complete len:242 (-) Transcript_52515:637-1362(-)
MLTEPLRTTSRSRSDRSALSNRSFNVDTFALSRSNCFSCDPCEASKAWTASWSLARPSPCWSRALLSSAKGRSAPVVVGRPRDLTSSLKPSMWDSLTDILCCSCSSFTKDDSTAPAWPACRSAAVATTVSNSAKRSDKAERWAAVSWLSFACADKAPPCASRAPRRPATSSTRASSCLAWPSLRKRASAAPWSKEPMRSNSSPCCDSRALASAEILESTSRQCSASSLRCSAASSAASSRR